MDKNMEKQRGENSYKAHYKLFFMVCMVLVMSISMISAFDFDNVQKIKENRGLAGYKNIEIENAFGLGKTLWSGTLNSNTDVCRSSCSATQTITLHDKGSLIDDVIFKTNKSGVWIEQPIRSYQIYVDGNPYILGTEMEAGTYEVTLEGEKKPSRTVDWIYKTQGEVLSEWAVWGVSPLDTGLRAYYKMDTGSGTNVLESVDGTANGTLFDGAWATGILGESTNYSADLPSYTSINSSAAFNFGTGNGTISLWYYANKAPGGETLIQKRQTAAGPEPGIRMLFDSATQIKIGFSNGQTVSGISPFVAGQWYHILMRRGGTNVSLWVNGTIVGSVVDGGDSDNINNTVIGGRGVGNLNGRIDELGSWNRSLNSTEIAELYNAGVGITYPFGSAIVLNTPEDNFISALNDVEFNCTATQVGATVANMSLWHDGTGTWERNQTNIVSGATNTTIFNSTFTEGNYNWTCEACDSDGDCTFANENRSFSVDITPPTIIINRPNLIENYGAAEGNQTLNWTVTDNNLDSIWFEYNGTNTTIYGASNQTNFTIENSLFNITIWANDTAGNLNSTYRNWSYYLFERASAFSTTALETTQEPLQLEVEGQSGLSSISANLWYDGTEYASLVTNPSGDIYNATNSIEVPIVSTSSTKNFFWSFDFKLANGTDINVNSSIKSQDVNRTWLTLCNATYPTAFVNFSMFDAFNPFPQVNGTFKITWDWYIQGADGSIRRNASYEDITEKNQTWSFCGSPAGEEFVVDAVIEFDGIGSAQNYHYLNDFNLSNATTNISLYLLNDSDATLTVLRVQDGAQSPLENYRIEIQAYDVGTGLFNVVSMAETSFNGEDLTYLNWYDTQYKFIITDPTGAEVLNTEPYKISETPQIFEITTETTYDFDKFEDIIYSLTFNETTNIFTLIYAKPTDVSQACLRVIKRNILNDTEVCLNCQTAASATINCDVTTYGNGTYIAAFYGTGSLKLIDAISVIVDLQNQIFNALGNLDATAMAIVFAGIVMVMFLVSPVFGIIGALLGMVGAVSLGFQPLEGNFYFVYIGMILMGGTIAWLMKK